MTNCVLVIMHQAAPPPVTLVTVTKCDNLTGIMLGGTPTRAPRIIGKTVINCYVFLLQGHQFILFELERKNRGRRCRGLAWHNCRRKPDHRRAFHALGIPKLLKRTRGNVRMRVSEPQ